MVDWGRFYAAAFSDRLGVRVNGIPGPGVHRDEIGAGGQSGEFVEAAIVGSRIGGPADATDTGALVLNVQRNLCMANGIANFVEDFAGEYRLRCEAENEVLGVNVASGNDGGGVALVLVDTRTR